MEKNIDIMSFLEKNVKPATGCTEIVAVGISTCAGYNALFGNMPYSSSVKEIPLPKAEKLDHIEIVLDKRLYKNAYSVNIPNTDGRNGIALAAAIGLFLNINKTSILEIFRQIGPETIKMSESILDKVSVVIDNRKRSLYARSTISYDGHTVVTVLENAHDNIVSIGLDGKNLPFKRPSNARLSTPSLNLGDMTIYDILGIVEDASPEVQDELRRTIELNMALVVEGLCHFSSRGGIVNILKSLIKDGLISEDISTKIKIAVASAVEARMGGVSLSAMSSSGSGNMGITATVPIIIVGQELDKPEEDVLKSLLLSHMIVRMASDNIGELSVLCGASNKSAFGAAAGIAYLLGAGPEGIINSINMVASNLIGATCDGAKSSCALKAMSSAAVAYDSALMGTWGLKLGPQGIVGNTAKETLKNVSEISRKMDDIDDAIVKILKRKVKR